MERRKALRRKQNKTLKLMNNGRGEGLGVRNKERRRQRRRLIPPCLLVRACAQALARQAEDQLCFWLTAGRSYGKRERAHFDGYYKNLVLTRFCPQGDFRLFQANSCVLCFETMLRISRGELEMWRHKRFVRCRHFEWDRSFGTSLTSV